MRQLQEIMPPRLKTYKRLRGEQMLEQEGTPNKRRKVDVAVESMISGPTNGRAALANMGLEPTAKGAGSSPATKAGSSAAEAMGISPVKAAGSSPAIKYRYN